MKLVAAVFADFVVAPTGGPSQLAADLGGQPVLTHTLQRVAQITDVAARYLVVSPRDADLARAALAAARVGAAITLLPIDTVPRQRRVLLTAARKWNLESWRGGLLGVSWFDEFVDPRAVSVVAHHTQSEGVLCFEGHQAALDPQLASDLLHYARGRAEDARMVFTQAPPGLAGMLLRQAALVELLEFDVPVGLVLAYRPELAQPDPITQSVCMPLPTAITQTAARFVADTRRSRELLAAARTELGADADAAALCRWAAMPAHDRTGGLPVEIELELTTADPLPDTILRPRGRRVPRRELTDLGAVERIARELARYDDRLVVLGGFGDPLLHPRFPELCHLLRNAGVYGVAVTSPLVELSDAVFAALFDEAVDALEIVVDAHDAVSYLQVHKLDMFARVQANIERLAKRRREGQQPRPVLVGSLTRHQMTLPQLEAFYDAWIEMHGAAVIRGYDTFGGALPDDTLLSTMPTVREPCRRLGTRLMLLADGTAALCSRDFGAVHPLGDWTEQSLAEIWTGPRLAAIRNAQLRADYRVTPLCETCAEWSRP
jgi:hypothetical protein